MFNLLILTSLVCVLVCASRFALSHHQRGTDFGHEGGFGGPYLCAPSNSARVQNRFEFVELGRDMSSNCAGEVQARTGISGWYQLVTRTIYVPVYMVRRGSRGSPVCYVLVRTWYRTGDSLALLHTLYSRTYIVRAWYELVPA